jgi:hypothetical protein
MDEGEVAVSDQLSKKKLKTEGKYLPPDLVLAKAAFT